MTARGAGRRARSAVIVGGGPVGLTVAALLLARTGSPRWSISLLEPRPSPLWTRVQVDLRVYALSRASQNILDAAGAWAAIAARRISPYRRMTVWEGARGGALGTLTFDSAEIGEPDLGHIVEDRLVRQGLLEALAARGDTQPRFGVELAAIRVRARGVEITTSDGEVLSADLVIAADGGASTVRALLDLPVAGHAYEQEAVVAHVGTERPHAQTAWQHFLPTGPVALLPLLDGRSSVVWSTATERAQALVAGSDAEFSAELETATDGVLGRITAASARASFPLRALHAQRYCCSRVVLVGDAAHTIHPLAGQGMNLGLLDAAALAEVLDAALASGEDPGDLRVLRRYERRQKGRNLKTLLTMDALHTLFTRAGPLLAPLRASGMRLIDVSPPAKRLLMREALGLTGELPASARSRVA